MKKKICFLSPVLILFLFFLAAFPSAAFGQNGKNGREFEVSKNLDIFNSIFKELDLYYVDSISPEKQIKTGIDAMLGDLDPYTDYIPESEMGDLKFMTTGEYAGIGAVIGQRDNKIYIIEVYEGMPTQKNGLKAGDVFVEVDGVKTDGKSTSEVSEMLKGAAHTSVNVTVERLGEKRPIKKEIIREKITINPLSYAGVLSGNIGYINLSGFTDNASDYFKDAFLDLKNKNKIESLIIDLRNNPGGIMDEAIKIINFFVEKKSLILYTKGKVTQWDEVYKATREPIDKNIPIVVLVNRNSASASEILSGALQDLDRAVIAGERTFGKGLVQTTRDLPYGGSLKVTVAKYYIPSGRSIQAIDYTHRNENGSAQRIPDSLTTAFKTAGGRIVRDGGGIYPDLFVEPENNATISYYLYANNLIFDYANQYQAKRSSIAPIANFTFTDYDDFKNFVKSKNFTYKLKTEDILNNLKEVAQQEGYYDMAENEFKAMEDKLSHNLDKDLDLFKDEISDLISIEIAKRYYYRKGEIVQLLKNDKTTLEAIRLLNDQERYKKMLQP